MASARMQKSGRKGLPDTARYALSFHTLRYAHPAPAAETLGGLVPALRLPSRPQMVLLVHRIPPLPLPRADSHPFLRQTGPDMTVARIGFYNLSLV